MQRRSPGYAWLTFPVWIPLSVASAMSLLAALLVVVAGSPSTAAPAAAATPAAAAAAGPCAPVLLVGVEGPRDKRAPGATFSPVLMQVGETFRARAAATGRAVQLVRVVTGGAKPERLVGKSLKTKAKHAVTVASATAWMGRVGRGQSRAAAALSAAAAACPEQQIVLAGYSQGATALHRSLGSFESTYGARLMGAILIGDGDRVRRTNAGIVGAPAAPARGRGIGTKLLGNNVDAPASPTGTPVISVCSKGDVVCDLRGNPAGKAVAKHRSYATGGGAAAVSSAASSMWSRVASWARASTTNVRVPVNQPFSQQLTADVDPAQAPYVEWSQVSGLPDWASLSSTGLLTGTAPAEGSWTVSYAVRTTNPPSPYSYGQFVLTAANPEPMVSAGGQSACEVREDTSLWCWGNAKYGQVGDGQTKDRTNPQPIGTPGWGSVSASGSTACGIRLDQTLWCWGMNHRGQLGIGKVARQLVPVQVAPLLRFAQVSTGWLNTCAIAVDTSLWCWGDNSRGQVGVGDTKTRYTPTLVSPSGWTSVTIGGYYACGTRSDGAASCWGQNSFGQLGTGSTANSSVPAAVAGGLGWQRLDAGWASTCGLTTLGQALCWGLNDAGQLGSSGPNTASPREVQPGTTWQSVTVGDSFGCGVTTSSEATCWGSNRYGQLGDGQASLRVETRKVSGTWGSVDAGWYSVCARPVTDGPSVCWGNNERGQLGRGDRINRNTPRGQVAARPFPTRERRDPNEFVATSFNILGSQHTEPGGGVPEWAPGRLRSEWAANLIQRTRTGVMGFQEIQPDQIRTMDRIIGDRFDFWPGTANGPRAAWQTVAWDNRKWELVTAENVDLPVLGTTRPHPLVLLRNKATGKSTWLFNIHNSSKNTPERKKERRKALKLIVKQVKKKRRDGTPLILLGDFNDRKEAFCTVTGKTDLKATNGGRFKKGRCKPPRRMGIDWIFASKDLKAQSFSRERNLMILRITDHPVLYSTLKFK
jgi:alpha-tubulin suppressor-like RCC1 family protein/endonuclease/exonuclease/phosphatase family metal-dependent hydrolase